MLCCNLEECSIATVDGLNQAVDEMFDHPDKISWLDLSFNMLTTIEAVTRIRFVGALSVLYTANPYAPQPQVPIPARKSDKECQGGEQHTSQRT